MRRNQAETRTIEPDALHRSRLVQQVVNKVMLDGKKSTSERIVYDALGILGEKTGKDPVEALEESIKALTPVLEVRSRRVGGATYQVPVEVPQRRAKTLAVRWLVQFARATPREDDGPAPGQRAPRRPAAAGRRLQAQGRHLPHGAGEQGVRALPLVDASGNEWRLLPAIGGKMLHSQG
jgi:ribosomal protein S7